MKFTELLNQQSTSPKGFVLALLLAGAATLLNEADAFFHLHNVMCYLHLLMQAAKGFCYIGSGAVGYVTVHKYLRSMFKKRKDENLEN